MAPLKNPRHEKFVQAYVSGKNAGNATACYVEVYGPAKGSHVSANRMLNKARVVSRLDELQAKAEAKFEAAIESAAERLGITQEYVLGCLKENVDGAIKDKDRNAANRGLELLGRHVGLFLSTGDTINNVLQIGVQLIDRPPDETYEQWIARRRRELTHKTIEHTNGHAKNGNGQGH